MCPAVSLGLSPRRSGFDPGSVHVRLVVEDVALEQNFLRVLRFSPVSIIPNMVHTHLCLQQILPEGQTGRNLVTFEKPSALSEIGVHWIRQYFRLFFFSSLERVNE